jgi:hypothetical protein
VLKKSLRPAEKEYIEVLKLNMVAARRSFLKRPKTARKGMV